MNVGALGLRTARRARRAKVPGTYLASGGRLSFISRNERVVG